MENGVIHHRVRDVGKVIGGGRSRWYGVVTVGYSQDFLPFSFYAWNPGSE